MALHKEDTENLETRKKERSRIKQLDIESTHKHQLFLHSSGDFLKDSLTTEKKKRNASH